MIADSDAGAGNDSRAGAGGPPPPPDDVRRVLSAGVFALLAVPVAAAGTLVAVGEWRLDGAGSLVPLALVAAVGAGAAAWAGRAPVALGSLAGLVLALWSLPNLPGMAVLLGAGAAGGWYVGRERPMAVPSDAANRVLVGLVVAALPTTLALSAAMGMLGEHLHGGLEATMPAGVMNSDLDWSCPPSFTATDDQGVAMEALTVDRAVSGEPLVVRGGSRIESNGAFVPPVTVDGHRVVHYVVVRALDAGGGVWAAQTGGARASGDRPRSGLDLELRAHFNGMSCSEDDPPLPFDRSARPGPYTAQALLVFNDQVWAGPPVTFELQPAG